MTEGWHEDDLEHAPDSGEQTASTVSGVAANNSPESDLAVTIKSLPKFGKLAFDERSQQIMIALRRKKALRPLADHDLTRLRLMFDRELGFMPSRSILREAIEYVATKHRFDPFWDRINAFEWDGKPRLPGLLSTYFRADDNELHRAIGVIALVAAVRRARRPGCKYDLVPFLVGPQGCGKSTALYILALEPRFFADAEVLHLSPREQMEMCLGVVIFELAERGGMHQTTAERYKAFVSRREDRARPAYAPSTLRVPRRFTLWGTTNDAHFLRDPSGNRRFVPIKVGRIDLTALRRDVHQLWAEAVALESDEQPIRLPKNLWPDAAKVQSDAVEMDPWVESLRAVHFDTIGDQDRVPFARCFNLLHISPGAQSTQGLARLTVCMQRLGWTRAVGPFKCFDGKAYRGFTRPSCRPQPSGVQQGGGK